MQIIQIEISKLKPAEYNPRVITDDEAKGLQNSLKEFGFVDPAIVNKDFTIIGGHQRISEWGKLGNTTAPCIVLDLNKKQEKKLNIILNSQAISGKYDQNKLDSILNDLKLDDDFKDLRLDLLMGINADDYDTDFELPSGDKAPFQQMTFTLADEQAEQIKNAIAQIKQSEEYKYVETMGNENSNGNALYLIIMQWAGQRT